MRKYFNELIAVSYDTHTALIRKPPSLSEHKFGFIIELTNTKNGNRTKFNEEPYDTLEIAKEKLNELAFLWKYYLNSNIHLSS